MHHGRSRQIEAGYCAGRRRTGQWHLKDDSIQAEISARNKVIKATSKLRKQLNALIQALRWRAYWLAPNLIRIDNLDDECEKKRERESNEAGRVPEEDELRSRMIWGVEVFGPNEIEELYKSLKTLGWHAGFIRSEEDALRWVQEQRNYGWSGSYNVGLVVRKSDRRRWIGRPCEAELPNGVDHLLVRIYQITPAITSLVVGFALNEEASRRYETELNLDRRSRRERRKRWSIAHLEPSHQKQEAIADARAELRCSISDWFYHTVPGYFSTQGTRKSFPFAELLTTAGDDVFTEREFNLDFDWRRILANPYSHDIWTSKAIPALKFVLKQPQFGAGTRNWIVATVSVAALPQDSLKTYGGGAYGVANLCHEALNGLLAYFGVSSYLSELSRDLKVAREELNLSTSGERTLKIIERIQHFFDRNVGVPVAARELRDITKRSGWLMHYCGRFMATDWSDKSRTRDFASQLQANLHRTASALIEDESSTREHFEQLSTILSIRESVRAQHRMELVAVLALVVATITLAIDMPEGWFAYMKKGFFSVANYVASPWSPLH